MRPVVWRVLPTQLAPAEQGMIKAVRRAKPFVFWQCRRARYRGTRKSLFDLRRVVAMAHNLQIIAASRSPTVISSLPYGYLPGTLAGHQLPRLTKAPALDRYHQAHATEKTHKHIHIVI